MQKAKLRKGKSSLILRRSKVESVRDTSDPGLSENQAKEKGAAYQMSSMKALVFSAECRLVDWF